MHGRKVTGRVMKPTMMTMGRGNFAQMFRMSRSQGSVRIPRLVRYTTVGIMPNIRYVMRRFQIIKRAMTGMSGSSRNLRDRYTRPLTGMSNEIQAAWRLYQTAESESPQGGDRSRRATQVVQLPFGALRFIAMRKL